MLIALGIFFFVLLVVVHEWGHFLAARRNGVEVEEFGIGFPPPRLWARKSKKDKTVYTINLIPLGGFVKLKGEFSEDKRPNSYGATSLWVKTKITLAGVSMNFLAAALIFTILAIIGMPQMVDNQYNVDWNQRSHTTRVLAGFILEDSPGDKAGIERGDEILFINDIKISSPEVLLETTEALAGQEVTIEFEQEKVNKKESVTLNRNFNNGFLAINVEDDLTVSDVKENDSGAKAGILVGDKIDSLNSNPVTTKDELFELSKQYSESKVDIGIVRDGQGVNLSADLNEFGQVPQLGVGPAKAEVVKYGVTAPIVGVGTTVQMTALTVQGLWNLVTDVFNGDFKEAGSQVTGPVGVVTIIKDFSTFGIAFVLFLIAIISIALGVMNSLPIPPLDGGRLALTATYRALKKPLTQATEEKVLTVGYLALIALIIVITFLDIKRL